MLLVGVYTFDVLVQIASDGRCRNQALVYRFWDAVVVVQRVVVEEDLKRSGVLFEADFGDVGRGDWDSVHWGLLEDIVCALKGQCQLGRA